MRIGIGSGIGFGQSLWSPLNLFADGTQGAWYDFSDLNTLYQDSAGTTAGAVGQPLGLVLDKSRGAVRGSELLLDPGFDNPAKWAVAAGVVVASSVATYTAAASGTIVQCQPVDRPTFAVGDSVFWTLTVDSVTAGGIAVVIAGATGPTISAAGTYSGIVSATAAGAGQVGIRAVGVTTAVVSFYSAKPIPGNHVTQATSTARPSLVLPTSYYAARADGVDDSLAATTGGGGSAGILICAAITLNGGAGGDRRIWNDSAGPNNGYILRINTTNKVGIAAGNGVTFTILDGDAFAVGETHVVMCWDDGVNLNVQLDNGAVASVGRPAVAAGTAGFTLFKNNSAANVFFNGDCHALVYVKNPSAAAIAQIPQLKRWVGRKAGLSL